MLSPLKSSYPPSDIYIFQIFNWVIWNACYLILKVGLDLKYAQIEHLKKGGTKP